MYRLVRQKMLIVYPTTKACGLQTLQSESVIEFPRPYAITRICPAAEPIMRQLPPPRHHPMDSLGRPDNPADGQQEEGRLHRLDALSRAWAHPQRRGRSISVELDSKKAEKPSERAPTSSSGARPSAEGLGSFRGLTRRADIVRVIKAAGASPDVVVNKMHGKRVLDYGRRNCLLVDVKIPMAV